MNKIPMDLYKAPLSSRRGASGMHLGACLLLISESWLLFAAEGCLCCRFCFGVFCFVLCLRKVSLCFPNRSGIPDSPISVSQEAGNTGCAHMTLISNELILKFLKVLGLRFQFLSRHRLEAWNSSAPRHKGRLFLFLVALFVSAYCAVVPPVSSRWQCRLTRCFLSSCYQGFASRATVFCSIAW